MEFFVARRTVLALSCRCSPLVVRRGLQTLPAHSIVRRCESVVCVEKAKECNSREKATQTNKQRLASCLRLPPSLVDPHNPRRLHSPTLATEEGELHMQVASGERSAPESTQRRSQLQHTPTIAATATATATLNQRRAT